MHYLYVTWAGIHQRCYNSNHPTYKYYGNEGITVCDRWHGKMGFKNFVADMGDRPSPKHTVDRIKSTGNYEPSNCRWATPWQQALNRRSTTNHVGVSFIKRGVEYRWSATMTFDRKLVLCQQFKTYKEAIAARQAAELKYLGVILQPEAANLELDT